MTQTVTDGVSTSTATRTIVAVDPSNQPPVADAGPDIEVDEGAAAFFDASGTHDPDGTIFEYLWDFGDGGGPIESPGPTTSHAYGVAGDYTVRLVVTDDGGATAEDTVEVHVGNRPPTLSLPHVLARAGRQDRPYAAFVGTGQGEPTTVEVDFGDGSAPVEREITGPGTPAFDHAYAAAGTYERRVHGDRQRGGDGDRVRTVVVTDAVADAGADVTVDEGEPVTLGAPAAPRTPTRP